MFCVHLCCEIAHVCDELLEDWENTARQMVISPGGMNGVEARSPGGSPVSKTPAGLPACPLWHFTLEALMHLPSCSLAFYFSLFLSVCLCLSSPLSLSSCPPSLYMPVPSPALFGLFISTALISMESNRSDKHIRLNIGLCRKRGSVSLLLPALRDDPCWIK